MDLTAIRAALQGKKTYIVAAAFVVAVVAEKGLGIDVPGVTVGDDWLLILMNALGLGTLRAGLPKTGN